MKLQNKWPIYRIRNNFYHLLYIWEFVYLFVCFPLHLFQSLSFLVTALLAAGTGVSLWLCYIVFLLLLFFSKVNFMFGSWFFSRWIVWTLFLFCIFVYVCFTFCVWGGLNQTLFTYCNEMVYLFIPWFLLIRSDSCLIFRFLIHYE